MRAWEVLEKVYGFGPTEARSGRIFRGPGGLVVEPPDWTDPGELFGELGELGRREGRPVLDYVEVGSWLGGSVRRAAGAFPEAEGLVCVDTWLGGAEHWVDRADGTHDLRGLEDGTPGIWEQFKCNVCRWGLMERVAPLRMSSTVGAQVLGHHGYAADVVYVDGGHAYREVLADCLGYWPLCRRWLVGDDWGDPRFGVAEGVVEFMRLMQIPMRRLQVVGGMFWVVEKVV